MNNLELGGCWLSVMLLAGSLAQTVSSQTAGQKSAPGGGEIIVNSLGMKLAYIPAGAFDMGSPAEEKGRQDDERQHRVRLTRPFRIGVTEVTQEQWRALMGYNRSHFRGDSLPVEKISFKEALKFCDWLSQKEGRRYRLPTEAEWEYACRAGTAGRCAGNGSIDEMGWYRGNSGERTHPVATKSPNKWGLFDMHGNVAEWCSDSYQAEYPAAAAVDPAGPAHGDSRVVRGGSWNYYERGCRCAARSSAPEAYQFKHTGLRVVLELSP